MCPMSHVEYRIFAFSIIIIIVICSDTYKGLMFANGECVTSTYSLVRLWLHETSRIYGDKLIETKDQVTFSKTICEQIKKSFSVSILIDCFNVFDFNELFQLRLHKYSSCTYGTTHQFYTL